MNLLSPGFSIIAIILPVLVLFILWLWTLIDALRSTFKSDTEKLMWVMLIVFLSIIGAILYILIGRNQRLDIRQNL
jgi:hypothetical protein